VAEHPAGAEIHDAGEVPHGHAEIIDGRGGGLTEFSGYYSYFVEAVSATRPDRQQL